MNAEISSDGRIRLSHAAIAVRDYDLATTLDSGQAFRWIRRGQAWEGVIGDRWVRLEQAGESIVASTPAPAGDWRWLNHYLQHHVELDQVLSTFPQDEPMRRAVNACRGLRVLRQEPWECLATFILSSTKQIVQIRQIVDLLCSRFGEPVVAPAECGVIRSFPTAHQIACLTESELRGCKMGFRAPYLLETARQIAGGHVVLADLSGLTLESARAELLQLPGVGRKVADCILLFAYGFPTAFPVDVWVLKALRELYFRRRRPGPKQLRKFSEGYFGPQSGYAQQYLFHYIRTRKLSKADLLR